jgi:hypothetical protein
MRINLSILTEKLVIAGYLNTSARNTYEKIESHLVESGQRDCRTDRGFKVLGHIDRARKWKKAKGAAYR